MFEFGRISRPVTDLLQRLIGHGASHAVVSIPDGLCMPGDVPNSAWSREGHPDWEIAYPPAPPREARSIALPAGAVLTAHGWESMRSVDMALPGQDGDAWRHGEGLFDGASGAK